MGQQAEKTDQMNRNGEAATTICVPTSRSDITNANSDVEQPDGQMR